MSIEMNVKKRDAQGTGASRRLRRAAQVPAIIYGGNQPALAITLDHAAGELDGQVLGDEQRGRS